MGSSLIVAAAISAIPSVTFAKPSPAPALAVPPPAPEQHAPHATLDWNTNNFHFDYNDGGCHLAYNYNFKNGGMHLDRHGDCSSVNIPPHP
jgi:hypothetical protein